MSIRSTLLCLLSAVLLLTSVLPCAFAEETDQPITLTIGGDSFLLAFSATDHEDHWDEMMKALPQWNIQPVQPEGFVFPCDDPQNDYLRLIESGSEEADMFVLPVPQFDVKALINRGAMAPMADGALLRDEVAHMDLDWSGILDKLTNSQGVLCAYPVGFEPYVNSYYADRLEEAGINELPATLNDYIALIRDWYAMDDYAALRAKYCVEHNTLFGLFYTALRANIHASLHGDLAEKEQLVSFNTPAFRETMQLLYAAGQVMPEKIEQDRLPLFGEALNICKPIENQIVMPDLPLTDAATQSVYHTHLNVMVINPNSPRRAECIRFLKDYMAARTPYQLLTLFPFDVQEGDKAVSEEMAQAYRSIAKDYCMDCHSAIHAAVWEIDAWKLVAPYFEGSAGLDAVLEQLDAQFAAALNAR